VPKDETEGRLAAHLVGCACCWPSKLKALFRCPHAHERQVPGMLVLNINSGFDVTGINRKSGDKFHVYTRKVLRMTHRRLNRITPTLKLAGS
jgi:hypothetical protein